MNKFVKLISNKLYLILIPLFLFGCSQSQSQPLNQPQPQQQARIDELYADDIVYDLLEYDNFPIENKTDDAFFKYTNPEGTFSIIFQNFPSEEIDLPTDSVIRGGKVVRNSVWAFGSVTYIKVDNPQEYVSEVIERRENSLLQVFSPDKYEETVLTTELFNEYGYSGHEIILKVSNTVADVTLSSFVRERVIITEDYIYLLGVPPSSEEKAFGEEATKFFGSFQLIEN